MSNFIKEIQTKNSLVFIIWSILIVGLISFVSCESEEKAEEGNQQIITPQDKVEELQKEIDKKDKVINQLKEEKADLLSRVPEPYEVYKGDSHWQIAYDYLSRQKKLTEDEAKAILANIPLFHPILVGFKVWNYFYDGIYGTFVSQGNASVSLGVWLRIKENKETEEKQRLEREINEINYQSKKLAEKIEELEKENSELKVQYEEKINALDQEVNGIRKQNRTFESRINSMYYLVGTKENLKAKGKIKSSFLGICGMRIKEVAFADFENSVDLRESEVIEIKAKDFGISRIKKVRLLPKHLDESKDFRIEIDTNGKQARVNLLNKEEFRLARIILYLN